MKLKKLTWDDLADEYHKMTGRQARIRPMDEIFEWAENQREFFRVDKKGYLCKIIREKKK